MSTRPILVVMGRGLSYKSRIWKLSLFFINFRTLFGGCSTSSYSCGYILQKQEFYRKSIGTKPSSIHQSTKPVFCNVGYFCFFWIIWDCKIFKTWTMQNCAIWQTAFWICFGLFKHCCNPLCQGMCVSSGYKQQGW